MLHHVALFMQSYIALLGLVFRRGKAVGPGARAALRAPLIIGALPAAFYIFFWVIGPLYEGGVV